MYYRSRFLVFFLLKFSPSAPLWVLRYKQNRKKEIIKMKIEGLKVFADKGWRADSSFTNDNGVSLLIPANHKVVCQDENSDIVNVTFVTSQPLSIKLGEVLKGVTLVGGVTKTQFGWTVKAEYSK